MDRIVERLLGTLQRRFPHGNYNCGVEPPSPDGFGGCLWVVRADDETEARVPFSRLDTVWTDDMIIREVAQDLGEDPADED